MPTPARSLPRPAFLQIAGAHFIADPAGALYWHEEGLLVVADLHFEKGSAYAARKIFLPPYDTTATLAGLALLVAAYNPRAIVALGDSFHDGVAGERIAAGDKAAIQRLQRRRDWIWIAGNHDAALPNGFEGEARGELSLGPITFRHQPAEGPSSGEIAGHLHPVAKVAGRAGRVRSRCFVSDGLRCVLPAFGAYAGGLNLHDDAFAPLFRGCAPSAHVLGRRAVYRIPLRNCLPD